LDPSRKRHRRFGLLPQLREQLAYLRKLDQLRFATEIWLAQNREVWGFET